MSFYIVGYLVSVVGGILFIAWNNKENKENYRLNVQELLYIVGCSLAWPFFLLVGIVYGNYRIYKYVYKTVDYYWTDKGWKSRKIF